MRLHTSDEAASLLRAQLPPADGQASPGRVGVGACAAWRYPFHLTMEVALAHLEDEHRATAAAAAADDDDDATGGPAYMIFDIFTINQHPNRFFVDSAAIERTLQMMVVKPGRLLLVLHPWNDPIPLKRCWCLFEAFMCAKSRGLLTVGMAARDTEEFYAALQTVEKKSHFLDLVTSLDARNATATVARDAQMILDKIESSLGFDAFNGLLHKALLGALRRVAFRRFSSDFCSFDTRDLSDAEPSQRSGIETTELV